MSVSVARWLVVVALVCAATATLFLPFPTPEPAVVWNRFERTRLGTERDRVLAVAARLQDVVANRRAADALARWRARAARGRDVVTVDTSIPQAARAAVDSIVRIEWARLGRDASTERATAFVFFDTSSIVTSRRVVEPRGSVVVTLALPEATDGTRCVALVRMRTADPAPLAALPPGALFGACGFYAAFGVPGAAMRAWLDRTGFDLARRAAWDGASPARPASPTPVEQLPAAAGACAVRGGEWCLATLGLPASVARSTQRAPTRPGTLAGVVQPVGGGSAGAWLGDPELEARFLADMARELGPAKFGAIWRSRAALRPIFAGVTGTPLGVWTQRWIRRGTSALTLNAAVSWRDVLWLALALPLLTAVAFLRGRERPLAAS